MSTTTVSVPTAHDRIDLVRWPSEIPLFTFSVLIAIPIWLLLFVSIIGLAYAAMIGAFWFVLHLAFVSHVRGNGVRLGPDQFSDLHDRVKLLAHRMGMERVPEAYVMQAGGSLNAFATRFFRSNMIVLFSDLLEACGPNEAARDMIIAHELGHIRAGHLRWRWLTVPVSIVPFLGTALSRAREYTCDRIGLAGAGDTDGALLGLTILAAGGHYGPRVNRVALVGQRAHLATGWMTIGEWFSTHPPLARRLVALEPALALGRPAGSGAARAIGLLLLIAAALVGLGVGATAAVRAVRGLLDLPTAAALSAPAATDSQATALQVAEDLRRLGAFIDAEVEAGRGLPAHGPELVERWTAQYGEPPPVDPFDGLDYGYYVDDDTYAVWSSGPDGVPGTTDDISWTNEP